MVGGAGWIGGAIYTQNLARAISSLPPDQRTQIKLSIGVSQENLALAEPVRHCVDRLSVRSRFQQGYLKLCKILAEQVPLIPLSLLNPEGVDFVYPTVAGARSPYAWGGWIPDFQHYHLPHLFSEEEIASRNAWHRAVAQNAPVVVLSSQMAQQDFAHLYPEAASRSTVLNFATSLDPAWFQLDPKLTQETYQLPDRFFLVSNQFWKHKDHAVIIEALALLKQKGIQPTVVCTGNTLDPRHPDYYHQLVEHIAALGLTEQIRILGMIPRLDQIQLMRRCQAVIQPSRFEGWSTVVEDARTLGKPMLLSDFPVHLEQNPPHSKFFQQGNVVQLAELMASAYAELDPGPDFDQELSAKQENVRRVQAFGKQFLEIVRGVKSKS